MSFRAWNKVAKKYVALRQEFNETFNELGGKLAVKADDIMHNDSGNISAGSVIGLAISLIVIAAVIPSAIESFYSTNTTAWTINGSEDTKATTLWWLLPFICVAVVLYMVYRRME